jgi:transposase
MDETDKQEAINFKKRIVGIDPGKDDIIYAGSRINQASVKIASRKRKGDSMLFRYTQKQKNQQIKKDKYTEIRNAHKADYLNSLGTGDRLAQLTECEDNLSMQNSKSSDYDMFFEFAKEKSRYYVLYGPLYETHAADIHRRLKWGTQINIRRSEDCMVNRFKEKFGRPENVVIGLGDWSETKQMRFKEPSKTKGMRKVFYRNGYEVYLVDEYFTSQKCSIGCTGKLKEHANRMVLRCDEANCNTFWNRNVNACLNIYDIVYSELRNQGRPNNLIRL